jgi:Uma2 family endonuclease
MPTRLHSPDLPTRPETAPGRIRWTRQQCAAIREAGILTGRYELIEGEILVKMGQKPAHASAIVRLMTWLVALFGGEYVRIQLSLDVTEAAGDYNEPEPDVAVTTQPYTAYLERHPEPADLLLVIEVSDTTLRFDLSTKAALYARAGIDDYWVVDLAGRQIVVHRQPTSEGYQEIIAYAEAEELAPRARPEACVRVASLLPPRTE